MKIKHLAALSLAAGLAANTAQAGGFYFSLEAGQAQIDVSESDFERAIDDGSTITGSVDDRDRFRSAAVGWQLNDRYALEVGYQNLGEMRYSGSSDGSGSAIAAGPLTTTLEVDGVTVGAVYTHELEGDLALQLRAGAFAWDGQETLNTVNIDSATRSNDDVDAYAGVAISKALNSRTSLLAQLRYFGGDLNALAWTLGIQYRPMAE